MILFIYIGGSLCGWSHWLVDCDVGSDPEFWQPGSESVSLQKETGSFVLLFSSWHYFLGVCSISLWSQNSPAVVCAVKHERRPCSRLQHQSCECVAFVCMFHPCGSRLQVLTVSSLPAETGDGSGRHLHHLRTAEPGHPPRPRQRRALHREGVRRECSFLLFVAFAVFSISRNNINLTIRDLRLEALDPNNLNHFIRRSNWKSARLKFHHWSVIANLKCTELKHLKKITTGKTKMYQINKTQNVKSVDSAGDATNNTSKSS